MIMHSHTRQIAECAPALHQAEGAIIPNDVCSTRQRTPVPYATWLPTCGTLLNTCLFFGSLHLIGKLSTISTHMVAPTSTLQSGWSALANMLVLTTSTGVVAVVVASPVSMLAPRWVAGPSAMPVARIQQRLVPSYTAHWTDVSTAARAYARAHTRIRLLPGLY